MSFHLLLINWLNNSFAKFIDVTNVLAEYNNSFTYTATQDCYVGIQFVSDTSNGILNEEIKIDDIRVSQKAIKGYDATYMSDTFFLKKGHSITCVIAYGTAKAKVYGCI